MPSSARKPAKARAPRALRCSFVEGGQRCVRNASPTPSTPTGTGSVPLCNAHRVVFQSSVQQAQAPRSAGDVINSLFESFLGGFNISGVAAGDIRRGVEDMFRGMGGDNMGEDYRPPVGARANARAWQGSTGGQHQNADPRPRQDPREREAILRARALLGYGPSDRLTKEDLRDRRSTLAKKHHPDKGGSLERMVQINQAVDILMATL